MSHKGHDEWLESIASECPRCGEVSLVIQPDGESNCGACGHYEKHVAKYPGFDEWVRDFGGWSEIEKLSPIEKMQAAFMGGKICEAKAAIAELPSITTRLQRKLDELAKSPMAQEQAE